MNFNLYLLAVLLIIAFYTDIKNNKIPNLLCVVGALSGVLYHVVTDGVSGLLFSLSGLLIGFFVLFVLYLFKVIGAGDVKLFAAIGAIIGTQFTLYSIMYSIIYGGLIGLAILVFRRETWRRLITVFYRLGEFRVRRKTEVLDEHKKESLHFPFMYAVLPGVLTAFYYIKF